MQVVYAALQTFDSSSSEVWEKYVAWSHLTQLREVVTLDCVLCPSVLEPRMGEDWQHMSEEYMSYDLFAELDYLLDRVSSTKGDCQIIATACEPNGNEVKDFDDNRFVFKGFDVLDRPLGFSLLTNCGSLEKAFMPSDLSDCGLITSYERANIVCDLLREQYPNIEHAVTSNIWAVWRMERNI